MRRPESGSNKFDRHADALIFHILTPASLFPTLSSWSSETDIKSSDIKSSVQELEDSMKERCESQPIVREAVAHFVVAQ
jgi:hypothetical protein